MSTINIYDVSAYVHHGSYSQDKVHGYPVGGIRKLMEDVSISLGDKDEIILAFDSRSFRKDLLETYKSGRPSNGDVISQIETLYEGLQKCGIPCYKFDGMEADDIINWAVQQNRTRGTNSYNIIKIYGNDYDLCVNVQQLVEFVSINPKSVNSVSLSTFSTSLPYKERVQWNTVDAYKVFCGDPSDKISPIKLESKYTGSEIYFKFLEFFNNVIETGQVYPSWENVTSPRLVLAFAASNVGTLFTKEEVIGEISLRCKVIFPAENTDKHIISPTDISKINKEALSLFCSLYCQKTITETIGIKYYSHTSSDIEILKNKANAVNSGVYSVSKNLPASFSSKSKSLSSLETFNRGFS